MVPAQKRILFQSIRRPPTKLGVGVKKFALPSCLNLNVLGWPAGMSEGKGGGGPESDFLRVLGGAERKTELDRFRNCRRRLFLRRKAAECLHFAPPQGDEVGGGEKETKEEARLKQKKIWQAGGSFFFGA